MERESKRYLSFPCLAHKNELSVSLSTGWMKETQCRSPGEGCNHTTDGRMLGPCRATWNTSPWWQTCPVNSVWVWTFNLLSYLDVGSLLAQNASFTLIRVSAYRMNFMASVSSSLKKSYYPSLWASQVAHQERIFLPMQETQEILVWSLVEEDHMQDSMATSSSILVWRIPCKEPGGPQPMGSERVRGNLSTKQQQKICYIWHSFLSLSYILRLHLKPRRNLHTLLWRAPYTVTDKHCQDQEDTNKYNCISSQAFCFCVDLNSESKHNNKASEKATFSKSLFMCVHLCVYSEIQVNRFLGGMLLLLLSHFSRVWLCATP